MARDAMGSLLKCKKNCYWPNNSLDERLKCNETDVSKCKDCTKFRFTTSLKHEKSEQFPDFMAPCLRNLKKEIPTYGCQSPGSHCWICEVYLPQE